MINTKIIARPLTAAGIATVKELQALRGKLALTDAAFYRDRLLPFLGSDPTKWTKLQRNLEAGGSYTGRTELLEPKLAEALAALQETLRYDAVKARAPALPFHETSMARLLFKTIDAAREETDERRIIYLMLHPGCGKSAMLREVKRRYGGWIVQCTRGWYYSYGVCIRDTARAMGIMGPYATRAEWWNAIIREATLHPGVLAFDDFNTVGPAAIDMVRDINRLTLDRGGVQICAGIPAFYERLKSKGYFESMQVTTCSIMLERGCDESGHPLPDVLPGDVELFLSRQHFVTPRADVVKALCEAANHFGHFRFVTSVLKLLPPSSAEQPISDKLFRAAFNGAKKLFGREFGGGR